MNITEDNLETYDFYDILKKIKRPNEHSTKEFDFDFRKPKQEIWLYMNSSDDMEAFNDQIKVCKKVLWRIVESSTGKIVKHNGEMGE